ncbi:MAG TPA: ribonuclease E inhibitor RraB [Candidatus Angelobacter sp.]
MALHNIAISIVVAGFFGLFGGEEGDQALLELLEVGGSDLSKPHEIDFFLCFPLKPTARFAARLIAQAGFRTEVTKEEDAGWLKWDCQATKIMVPKTAALKRIRFTFSLIALLCLGKYDGWQTGPVK